MDTKKSYLLPVAGQKTPFLPSPSSQPFRGYLVLQLSKEQKAVRAPLLRSWQAPQEETPKRVRSGPFWLPLDPAPDPHGFLQLQVVCLQAGHACFMCADRPERA